MSRIIDYQPEYFTMPPTFADAKVKVGDQRFFM